MKKIIIINIANEFGGAEKSVVDLFKQYKKTNNILELFIINNDLMESYCSENGINFKKIKIPKFTEKKLLSLSLSVFYSICICLKFKPRLIISNTNQSHMISVILKIIFRLKTFWFVRDYCMNPKLKQISHLFVEKYFCPSRHVANYYNFYDKSKIVILPNGLEIKELGCYPQNLFKKKFNISKDAFFYGIITRIERWKGIEYAIEAFNKIEDDSYLIIAGTPNSTEGVQYLNFLKNISVLNNKIIWMGWIKDNLEFISNCDCIISSSVSEQGGPESFGRTIIEAWSLQKSVISTRCGGPSEIIDDNINGILVDEKSVDSLYEVFKNRDLIQHKFLATNGFKKITKEYSLSTISINFHNEIFLNGW